MIDSTASILRIGYARMKKIVRAAKVSAAKSVKPNPLSPFVAALQSVAAIVRGFKYVQNPATQWSQRPCHEGVKVGIILPGNKTPTVITLPAGYMPARQIIGGKITYDKSRVRDVLDLYTLGSLKDPRTEVLNTAAYLAFKVMTSRPRSLEGVLSVQTLQKLESDAGIRVVTVGEDKRDSLESKMAGLLNFLSVNVEAGSMAEVRGRRKNLGKSASIGL
jgi:hypothetical protein